MATRVKARTSDLYERDLYAWSEAEAELLRAGRFAELDLEHVTLEIEDVGGSLYREVRARVRTIMEHLLKLEHSAAIEPRPGWERTVCTRRADLAEDLTPALRPRIERNLARFYEPARLEAAAALSAHGEAAAADALPATCPQQAAEEGATVAMRGEIARRRGGARPSDAPAHRGRAATWPAGDFHRIPTGRHAFRRWRCPVGAHDAHGIAARLAPTQRAKFAASRPSRLLPPPARASSRSPATGCRGRLFRAMRLASERHRGLSWRVEEGRVVAVARGAGTPGSCRRRSRDQGREPRPSREVERRSQRGGRLG
jgi:hypothetical protein